MIIVAAGFLIGVITGIRWSYHDMEVAAKKWKELNRRNRHE